MNEFIAGTLFADVLVGSDGLICSEKVLDLATWAYQVRGNTTRSALYKATMPLRGALLPLEKLEMSLRLLRQVVEDLSGETIDGVVFETLSLGESSCITDCVFIDCTFRRVEFFGDKVVRCGFVQCKFYDCVVHAPCVGSWRTGGASQPEPDLVDNLVAAQQPDAEPQDVGLELQVLQQFWPKGRSHASSRLSLRTVYRGFAPELKHKVADAMEVLRRQGLLDAAGDFVSLSMERISEIRERLGR